MITAPQIRIGNYFNCNDMRVQVAAIGKEYVEHVTDEGRFKITDLEPIGINRSWFKSFYYDHGVFRLSETPQGVWIVEMAFYNPISEEDEWRIIQIVNYIHEWQNLYFALTGKELTK